MTHRVVVTGLGAVTPIGIGVDDFWNNLLKGKSGVSRITHFDPSGYRSQIAAEVKGFDIWNWRDDRILQRMDRFTQFAVAAAEMALRDSGLTESGFDSERAGVIIGSGIGGSETIEEGSRFLREKGPKGISPFFVSALLINTAPCLLSILYGFKGPLSSLSVACSTGSQAIVDAFRTIAGGRADIMLAGGTEACITPLSFAGFCATRSLSCRNDSPERASRPFDKNRDGFVMGEGAGVVVLESRDHALARNARIYAELAGYGLTADAYHLTAPEPSGSGMSRVMSLALEDAGIDRARVGYINAHGTSTLLNDRIESQAIREVFQDHAGKLKVSSNKSMIGHLMAAAGAVEFIATVMSIWIGRIPPTINYEEPDPDCTLDYVTGGSETLELEAALSNSFGFGGGNACLVVTRHPA